MSVGGYDAFTYRSMHGRNEDIKYPLTLLNRFRKQVGIKIVNFRVYIFYHEKLLADLR